MKEKKSKAKAKKKSKQKGEDKGKACWCWKCRPASGCLEVASSFCNRFSSQISDLPTSYMLKQLHL